VVLQTGYDWQHITHHLAVASLSRLEIAPLIDTDLEQADGSPLML
jgi:hypothetical protein